MANYFYKFDFQKGNYFYDKDNDNLIRYKEDVIQNTLTNPNQTSVATPISLNEDILKDALGFQDDGKGGYVKGGIQIDLNGTSPISILSCFGKPIIFLNDLQNVCQENGENLQIDDQKLRQVLNKIN